MSTTKNRKATRKRPDVQTDDVPTSMENEQRDTGKARTRGTDVRIVSVAFPARAARQLKLLSSVTGEPIAQIVVTAVVRVIAKRLPDALAEIARADDDASIQ